MADKLSLVRFLEMLAQTKGDAGLRRLAGQALQQAAQDRGFGVDEYLDLFNLRGRWRRAVSATRPRVDVFELAHCIAVLNVPLQTFVQTLPRPWDQWSPRSVLAVVIGKRLVQLWEQSRVPHWSNSGRDTEALARLVTLLSTEFGLQLRPELYFASPQMSRAEAASLVEGLRDRRDVGAVVAIGSPVGNPVADPMAELMLGGRPSARPLATFRFPFVLAHPAPFLCDPPCAPAEAGIRYANGRATSFARTPNEEVLRRALDEGDRGPFDDCGMLLIDCRGRCPLILCAGHGGCGTVAAVLALGCGFRINKSLDEDDDAGRDRALEVVTVRPYKPTPDPVDDLDFDPAFGVGWDFGW